MTAPLPPRYLIEKQDALTKSWSPLLIVDDSLDLVAASYDDEAVARVLADAWTPSVDPASPNFGAVAVRVRDTGPVVPPRRWYVIVRAGKPVAITAANADASSHAANDAAVLHGHGAVAIPIGVSVLPPTDEQILAAVTPDEGDRRVPASNDAASLDDDKYQRSRRGERCSFGF